MAKLKKSRPGRQAKHKKPGSPSRHDRGARLRQRNLQRQRTEGAQFPLVGSLHEAVAAMARVVDARFAFRLAILFSGMLLADDRRTVSAWLVAAGVRDDWDRFYDALVSLGQITDRLAAVVLGRIVKKFLPGPNERLLLGLDDTPTMRYGRHVEGAGVHHHPTPGPADGQWLYGHNWVTLAWLANHSSWGVIALPLLSRMYVRDMDVAPLKAKYGWKFRTKLELALELVTWCVRQLRGLGVQAAVWIAMDGAYAKQPLLSPLLELGVTVVSRLRKDARLFDVPPPPQKKTRGRPRIYGKNTISLAKRAAHRRGWETISYRCRGVEVTRRYKTFLATSKLVSGPIRVVLVRFDDGWAPYFCTDSNASVREILETVAARWSLEEHFHDVKETWGAGEQQVRNIWSNVACWNLNQWLFTLVELCSWDQPAAKLVDRTDRPWDNPHRRPSHADRRRAIAREMLHQQINIVLSNPPNLFEIQQVAASLLALCV
jgi:hypothetical protein